MKKENSTPLIATRELWLESAIAGMEPLFKSAGYDVPKVRVSCGWPSQRGLSMKKRCVGEAWSKDAASDGIAQIFISPWLDGEDAAGPEGALSVLVHEVVHAVVGNENKHNKVFGKCARAVGLEGKLTSTIAGEKLVEACEQWLKVLGPYPHSKLDMLLRPTKKQTTRMVKMECKKCGYVARTSRKWLDESGPCLCPQNHGPLKFKLPEELEDDTDESAED